MEYTEEQMKETQERIQKFNEAFEKLTEEYEVALLPIPQYNFTQVGWTTGAAIKVVDKKHVGEKKEEAIL